MDRTKHFCRFHPAGLDEAYRMVFADDDVLVLVGFGGGLTWGERDSVGCDG